MKKITKILGVGLTIAVLASMLIATAPASAGTLTWTGDFPFPTRNGADVVDLAVAANGTTIYAAGGTADLVAGAPGDASKQLLAKSTNGGNSWAGAATPALAPIVGNLPAAVTSVTKVAVAADVADGSVLAILAYQGATPFIYYSQDGATTWIDLAFAPAGLTAVNDLAIGAPTSTATHTIGVVGADGAGAKLWLFQLGGIIGGWVDTRTGLGWNATDFNTTATTALAVQFSPNYATDLTVAIVTAGADTRVQLANTQNKTWNGVLYNWIMTSDNSDGRLVVPTGIAGGASLALAPSFYGFDASTRMAYVGLNTGLAGLYRVADLALPAGGALGTAEIYSVAVNTAGDKLVAGAMTTNDVYRVAGPATALTFGTSVSVCGAYKKPSAGTKVSVAYAGANVVAATYGGVAGDQSAFSVSVDDGKSFNDVSLVDAGMAAANVDIAVAADESKTYVATTDGTYVSLWRKTTGWQRVFVSPKQTPATADYMIKIAPENAGVVYFAEYSTVSPSYYYYTNDSGDTTWSLRGATVPFADMAVESATVVYALSGNDVYKSDGGFLWTKIQTNNFAGYMITSMGAGNLLVGGNGGVAYLTGGAWTSLAAPAAGNVMVTASGLAKDSMIYATSSGAVTAYSWKIGTSMTWTAMTESTSPFSGCPTGIGYAGGTLYVITDNGTNSKLYRTLVPGIASSIIFWSSIDATDITFPWSAAVPLTLSFQAKPNSFIAMLGADKNPKLIGLNTNGWIAGPIPITGIESFVDILTTAVPDLVGPVDKFENAINIETGKANNIVFLWKAVDGTPITTGYKLEIALDSAFTQVVYPPSPLTPSIVGTTAIIGESGNTGTFPYQADTTYYWRVKIVSPLNSNYSKVRSFKIGALAPLKINSPASGAQGVSVLPTFVWSPVTGATEYQIIVSDRENFDIITFSHNTNQAVYAVTEDEQLAYNTVYYWRVRASKPDTAVTQYQTGIFTTEQKAVPTKEPITITQPGPTTITVSVPPPQEVIPAYLLWIIIGIGAILVIALIVLIVRTRRTG